LVSYQPEPGVRMGEWRGKKALIKHQRQRSQHCQCCEDNDAIAKGWEGDGRSNAHSRDVEQVPIPGNGCSNPPTRPLDYAAIREWYRHANAATHPVAGVVINGNARSSARTHPVVDGAMNEGNRYASAATRSIEPAAIGRNARSNAPTDPVAGIGISERVLCGRPAASLRGCNETREWPFERLAAPCRGGCRSQGALRERSDASR
jgi:hypothetical protein